MDTYHLEAACPYCGRVNNRHTVISRVNDAVSMHEEHLTICYGCHGISLVRADGVQSAVDDAWLERNCDDETRAGLRNLVRGLVEWKALNTAVVRR